ncbi:MAG: hypothetical protein LBK56_11115 [Gracilibacteraceae bacterium]|jgi:hypothetical protein|nr:hypothetical protein [Gracilibacteraceae bacterium]
MRKKRLISICAILALALQLLLCPPVLAAGEDFSVTNYNLSGQTRITPGTSFVLHLTLSQLQEGVHKAEIDAATDIRFYIDETACSFYLTDGSEDAKLPQLNWFDGNISGDVKIPLTYDGGTRNEIPIKAKIRADGTELTIAGGTIHINTATSSSSSDDPEPTPGSGNTPYLRLKPRATPSGNAGERVYLSLTVENLGWENAKNVQIMPVFEEGSVFSPDGVNMIQDLGDIEYDRSRNISFSFLIDPAAATKVYTMTFSFSYMDPEGTIYGRDTAITDRVYINVTGGAASNLILADMAFTPAEGNITAALSVKNTGAFEAKNLTLALTDLTAETLTLTADTNVRKLGDLAGGASLPVSFVLRPAQELTRGSYPLTVKLTYSDGDGKDFEETQQIFVPVDSSQGGKTVPKIILDRYSCDPVIARAGENFTLNMTFLNTSAASSVRNIKIFLTVPQGDSDSTNSAAAKGSVFSPVSSSNTFFIDSIAPRGTSAKTLQFYTIPDASPRTYTLTANIEYEDETGKEYASEELIGIPVSQVVKIEVSELILPTEAYAGDMVSVSTNFYNTGRANVSNLMLNMEGDFQTDNARYYVGNFNTGATDYYEGNIIPSEPGLLEGDFVVSYDDPSGDHVEERYPFSLNVQEMPEFTPDTDMPAMPPPSVPWWKNPVVWGAAAGVIVLFFLLRKRGPVRKWLGRRKNGDDDEID